MSVKQPTRISGNNRGNTREGKCNNLGMSEGECEERRKLGKRSVIEQVIEGLCLPHRILQ